MATATLPTVKPDGRGRVALAQVIDKDSHYAIATDDDGAITLTPVALQLSPEQLADLQADPQGFVDLMNRSQAIANGAPTVSADEFWSELD